MRNKNGQKQWWVPVWTGLVMDEKGTHYEKIKSAIWLYLYLLLSADRKTGILKRKVMTICKNIGISERTVRRWLSTLAEQKYIEIKFTGRCLHIQIRKWKGAALPNMATQSCQKWKDSLAKYGNPEEPGFTEKIQDSCGKIQIASAPIDISMKRDILKIDIDSKICYEAGSNIPAGFTPKTREQRLAVDLAEGLNDIKGLPFYLAYSKRYPESLLRKVMQEVKALPDAKIKKSRGALFNHLVQKSGQKAI